MITGDPVEQRDNVPPLILESHMKPQDRIWSIFRKLNKPFKRQIDTLSGLVPVAVENDELVEFKTKLLAGFGLVSFEERRTVDPVREHIARKVTTRFPNFF